MGGDSLVMVSGTPESGTLFVNNAALLLTPWADALICVVPAPTASDLTVATIDANGLATWRSR
jgi:hypothetical protein